MSLRNLLRVLLTLGALWGSARADDSSSDALVAITAQLQQTAVLRGHFVQSKQIEGFRNPLRSSGHFLMAREQGVVWDTEKPFPSTIVLSQDQLVSRDAEGHARVLAADSQALSAVQALLMALIVGDFEQLQSQFEIQPQPRDLGWSLTMQPTDAALAQVFESIELQGDEYVRRVLMQEAGGDHSEIVFSELQTEPSALSSDEARLFD